MSFQALGNALSGLRVAQQQLSVISNNIANASSPGYTRKLLPQSAQVINTTGETVGVRAGTIIRNVDLNLERELWTQISSTSALNVKATYLDTIDKFNGPADKELSIAAQISALKDDFAALSDSPADGYLLQETLNQADVVADKFNDFGQLITQLRNDAQADIEESVKKVNDLLSSIATLNQQIKGGNNIGRTTADLEDARDVAVKSLSEEMDITFFKRGDGVMVIQTKTGVQLADELAETVYFNPTSIGTTTTYPSSVAGIYVGGNPDQNKNAVDVTPTGLGGKIGGLIELRDEILVQYQAQLDEMAHKLALRLDAQGLRLFTDGSGTIPSDAPPDPNTNPPTSVAYVGFSSVIQVNQAIKTDINLLQQGTYTSDKTIPSASNEVIRRVLEFGFGDVNYQQAAGTTNLNITAPATDLQTWLGLSSQNNVVGGIDLSSFPQISDGTAGTSDMMEDLQSYFPNYPANDQFQITFAESRTGLGPVTITVDLSVASANHPIGGTITNALDQIVAEINDQITAAGLPAGLTASAGRNTNGQLTINSSGNVTLAASGFAGAMGTTAFSALGWQEKTYATEDPYFDIQVGTGEVYRIKIEPGDTTADLIDKLEYDPIAKTGVPGLSVTFDAGTGRLTLRPGMDDSNGGPKFGGDIKIISGPGTTTGAVNPALAALPAGVNVVSALLGSYTVNGTTVTQTSPITNVKYGSEVTAGSGVYTAFRTQYLGAGANTKTGVLTGQNLIDFSQKVIASQSSDINLNASKIEDEQTLQDLLQTRLSDESQVNIDEELSNLIVIQTAYAAAARAVTAADDMFQELLNSIR